MASFNSITILGHVTREPSMNYLPSNTPVVELGIATNRKFKSGDNEREEQFFADLVAFGRGAEVINQYVRKGNLLFVTARAKTESWEREGQKRSKIVFVIDTFQLMPNGQRDSNTAPPARPATRRPQAPAADRPDAQEQFGDDDPNSIPF